MTPQRTWPLTLTAYGPLYRAQSRDVADDRAGNRHRSGRRRNGCPTAAAARLRRELGDRYLLADIPPPLGGEYRWCREWWQHAEAITPAWPYDSATTSTTSFLCCSAGAAPSPSAAKKSTSNPGRAKPTRRLPAGGRSITISSCRPAPPPVIRYPTAKAGDGGVVTRRRRYYKIEGLISLEDLHGRRYLSQPIIQLLDFRL